MGIEIAQPHSKMATQQTWVQCDRPTCQKWRAIPTDVAEALDNEVSWYVTTTIQLIGFIKAKD
jgi:hypothetical protein